MYLEGNRFKHLLNSISTRTFYFLILQPDIFTMNNKVHSYNQEPQETCLSSLVCSYLTWGQMNVEVGTVRNIARTMFEWGFVQQTKLFQNKLWDFQELFLKDKIKEVGALPNQTESIGPTYHSLKGMYCGMVLWIL